MNHHPRNLDDFYDSHVGARRQLYTTQRLADRLGEPTVIVSAILLVVAGLYNFWGSPPVERITSWSEAAVWDSLVYCTPRFLIKAVENWRFPSLIPRHMESDRLSTHAAKSEAMRKILGVGSSGSVVAAAFQARGRALSMSSMLGFKADAERPPGLGNRDNSCFQNSILQGLSSLPSLPAYLSVSAQATEQDDSSREVAQTLKALIQDLTDGTNNGKTIWTPSKLRFMSTWTQQDAQEYYSKILDDIDKSIAKIAIAKTRKPGFETESKKDESGGSQHSGDSGYQSLPVLPSNSTPAAMRNPLEGLLAQRVACVQCGYSEGLSMIPFNCLTLSLGLERRRHDLFERLDAYSKVEPIEGVECSKCTLLKAQRLLSKLLERMKEGDSSQEQLAEPSRRLAAVEEALEDDDFEDETIKEKCKIPNGSRVTTTKTKQVVIARPPQSLVVHMNRSVFDPSTFDMMKNSAPVDYPMTLDLGPWCLGSKSGGPSTFSSDMAPDEMATENTDLEHWALDARSSMIAGDLGKSRLTGPIYELRAAVTHSGRHENGHYVCYRKHPRSALPSKSLTQEAADGTDRDEFRSDDGVLEAKSGSEKEERSEQGDGTTEMEWWRLSDHNVTRVEEDTVLSLSPGVFMLFYDCVDSSMVVGDDLDTMQDSLNVHTSISLAEDEPPPLATPELTGDDEDDDPETGPDEPGTPRNPTELDVPDDLSQCNKD